jgi:transposase
MVFQNKLSNDTWTKTSLSPGAKCKLTEMEFETIAEKCRADYIGNQQTTVATMKQYVAEVTAAVESRGHDYTKALIHRLKDRGIQFVTGRSTSTAQVAANTSQNLAPFFEACTENLS